MMATMMSEIQVSVYTKLALLFVYAYCSMVSWLVSRLAPLMRLFRTAPHLGLLCRIFNRRWYQSDRASSLTRANNCRCSVLRDS